MIADTKKKIIVGMSGGVDSSVVAALLKEQGHEVIGLFMKNWEEVDEFGVCTSAKDYEDVSRVCDQLEIPYYSVEFAKEYKDQVFAHFLSEYRLGRTPNPDILCNSEIKFDVFFKRAMELGVDYLATGHYCQVGEGFTLKKGADPLKDQSYFLHAISGEVLSKVLFPIGHLKKSEVRELAEKFKLPTSTKKDSTGICFIGERNFRQFLSKYIEELRGEFQTLDGKVVGIHHGACYYTLGQRKGLGLGGAGKPWFVVAKDVEKKIVYVERGDDHPALYSDGLSATELSLIDPNQDLSKLSGLHCKLRYRQADQACRVVRQVDGRVEVEFELPQRAATPGQSIVFYQGDLCLGGAIIDKVRPSIF
jgi:tRNA-uridine 2-sulfurtransferase